MRASLQKLFGRATPSFEWANGNWTYNIFRISEYIFGRALAEDGMTFKIRPEMSTHTYFDKQAKKRVVVRRFYTVESLLCHLEGTARRFFTKPDLGFSFVRLPQFAAPMGLSFTPIYSFAIDFDATTPAGQFIDTLTSITVSTTVSGSNPFLIALGGAQQGPTFSSTSWNSSAGVIGDLIDIGGGGGKYTSFWKQAPATGTHDWFAQSGTNSEMTATVISYSGCAQTGQPDAHGATGFSSSTLCSRAITTVAANAVVFSGVQFFQGGTISASTNVNNVRSNQGNTTYWAVGDSNAIASPGSTTQVWTCGTSRLNAQWQVSIVPAAADAPNSSFFMFMH